MARIGFSGIVAGGVAAVAVAGIMAVAVPVASQAGGHAVTVGQPVSLAAAAAPGTPVACDRLKKQDERRKATLTRLQGDADTKGSIAWLTAKAARATESGDTARAKLYTDKAALRSGLVDPLKTVEADLAAVIKASCG